MLYMRYFWPPNFGRWILAVLIKCWVRHCCRGDDWLVSNEELRTDGRRHLNLFPEWQLATQTWREQVQSGNGNSADNYLFCLVERKVMGKEDIGATPDVWQSVAVQIGHNLKPHIANSHRRWNKQKTTLSVHSVIRSPQPNIISSLICSTDSRTI